MLALFCYTLPIEHASWYPLRLDPWQLSLKCSNSATELPNDSEAQLARAWLTIFQVVGSSLFLSQFHFFPSFFHTFISHLFFLMTLAR